MMNDHKGKARIVSQNILDSVQHLYDKSESSDNQDLSILERSEMRRFRMRE